MKDRPTWDMLKNVSFLSLDELVKRIINNPGEVSVEVIVADIKKSIVTNIRLARKNNKTKP